MIRRLTLLALSVALAGPAVAQTAQFDDFRYQGRSCPSPAIRS